MKKVEKFALALVVFCFLAATAMVSVSAQGYFRIKAPEMKGVHNVKQGLCVVWKRVGAAEGYIVYRQKAGNQNWKRVAQVSADQSSYTDTTVKHATTYKYVVKAFREKTKSNQSPNPKSNTFVITPKIKSVAIVRNGVRLKWRGYKDITLVSVYRRTQGSENWKKLASLSGGTKSFVDMTAKSGVKYSYQVRQSIGNVMSVRDGSIVNKTFIAAPYGLAANTGYSGVKLSWNTVQGAKRYLIYRKVQGEEQWRQVASSSSNSYYDKTAPTGRYVHYKVCAYMNADTVSAFSRSAFSKLIDPNKPMVALTYDDGPYRPVTNQILDVLEKYGARATFFVVGRRVSTYSDCIKRAYSLGCQIGNHTYNHKVLTEATDSQIVSEISATNSAIERCIGKDSSIVRAPGGSISSRVRNLVDYPLINWSVDTLDWKHRNTAKIIGNVKSNVTDGSIVLMHDLYSTTSNAAEVIIPWLINNGYQLVTVSEMMYYKGIRMIGGNVYYHG